MEQKFRNRLISLFFVALFLFGANFVLADKIKDFFYGQTSEIQSFSWQMANAIMFLNRDQAGENKKLVEENQRLLGALAGLQLTKEENKFLRDALNLGELKGRSYLEAEVFGGAKFEGLGFSYNDSLFITKGKKDGVQKGFPVVTADKILLGKVSEVYDNYSRVSLLTDKSSVVDVQIVKEVKKEGVLASIVDDKDNQEVASQVGQNTSFDEVSGALTESNGGSDIGKKDGSSDMNNGLLKDDVFIDKSLAIAKGEGSLKILLDMYPKDKELKDGDLVVTSSLSGTYPAGYVVGRIKDPKKIDTETFKQAEIVPAFDIKILSKVLILKDIEIVKND